MFGFFSPARVTFRKALGSSSELPTMECPRGVDALEWASRVAVSPEVYQHLAPATQVVVARQWMAARQAAIEAGVRFDKEGNVLIV